jgi:uncharacterized damage-inducible protein DinB
MSASIQFTELLDYTEEEARRWREFFAKHPEAADLPLDIAGSVRALVAHIVGVELYFARLISGATGVTPAPAPGETLDQVFASGEEATRLYRRFIGKAAPEDWHEKVELGRINVKASKRKLLTQALTHSMRHWAQISSYLRQQGFKQDWRHDFLVSKAME